MSEHNDVPGERSDSGVDSLKAASGESKTEYPGDQDGESRETPRRSGNLLAGLALLLALAAGGLAGWQWWLASNADEVGSLAAIVEDHAGAIDSQKSRFDELAGRLQDIEDRLEALADEQAPRDFDPAALRRQIRSQADHRNELRQQVSLLSDRLDQSISEFESRLEQVDLASSDRIEESLAEARFRIGLMEVAGLLRLGQARAGMAADPNGAITAYRHAQSRLSEIADGRLERLRQLVARELQALQSIQTTDWPALVGLLSVLEAESSRWPLAGSADQAVSDAGSGEATDNEGWWARLRHSMNDLVRVTPRESAPLTPAAVESVRERIRLHLAAAQAAAARRNSDELRQHLDSTEMLIRSHFDTAAEPVSRALGRLSAAAPGEPSSSLPDLGDALAEAERRLASS